ncbi:type 2 periplasmic-binding domain-containing protein [Shewanella woodyi]|uniref:Solute-binding protein family 3/N-terminal domain-containing protein n=1 Tax=Shewanella woodyi (strain ATCC 51908 / MS32) TaxID=392500 RepID=B1KMP5_SHEWM|nr:hypothetical protein [Shewanella woodyi]ACA87423.1 conserved hypothetical protein [Shewanella woodyi ATCC 51908]
MRILTFFSPYILLFCALPVNAEPQVIRYNISDQFVDPKQSYYIDLLRLALEKSREPYGDYQLQAVVSEMAQARTVQLVQKGELDLVWTMTSIDRERRLTPVYFPLLKGLMGYRIAIIRRQDKQRFADIESVEELQVIPVGQGSDWPDSDILQKQGFTLVRGAARSLLSMLNMHRFDYFLRALHEPWDEVIGHPSLMIDSSFVIIYPSPIYFFVNPDDKRLAERVEYGLRNALLDGSFEALFNHHAITSQVIERANLPLRRIFTLDNPLLSQESKNLLSEKELWFKQ